MPLRTLAHRLFMLALLPIAACGKKEGGGPTTAPGDAAAGGEVRVYMWSEYIDPRLPSIFEQRHGMKVRIDVYEATEEMMAKLTQAGGDALYDVIVVSDHAIQPLVELGALAPLDQSKITNAGNIMGRFRNAPYDPGNKYAIPYQWGTLGIMYRKDKVTPPPTSWKIIFDEASQPGPFVLIDSMRDMFAAALKFQGRSVNTVNVDEIRSAGELILAAKKSPKCIAFEGGVGGKNKVLSGDAVAALVYNGDAIRATEEEPNAAYITPEEGTIIWLDAMTLSAKAPNPAGAHLFMNFILEPEVGARLSNFNRYATPNEKSLAAINEDDRKNPAIYPPDTELEKMQFLEDLGDATKLYDEAWTAVKSR